MDYSRIYNEFISARKRLKPPGYIERHHILPRSLGGGDDPKNIVRLTPEDHFFAHLLLAKIHGGYLWAPVAFMLGGSRKGWQARRSRREYGWAVRAMAEARRGEGAYQFDRAIHRLEHKDGRRWSGHQADMTGLGFSRSLANMLVKGRVKSARGWFIEGHRPRERSGAGHPLYCADRFIFHNVDGRSFVGTSFELADREGISPQKMSNVRAGRQRVYRGWYRDGFPPLPVGRGAKLPSSFAGRVVHLRNRDGREFVGTERQACEELGLTRGNVSMVVRGQRQHTKGWSPADAR